MRIVFLSNYYNHHQAPFCKAMYEWLGNNFSFIQTEEMEAERCNMGWGDDNTPSFVRKSYGDMRAAAECSALIENADVAIIGSAPEYLVKKRITSGKLVIRYSERPLKKGIELWKYPYRYVKWHKQNPKGANIYMLCASAYTAGDYARFGLFRDRCYKWGYFPEVKRYEDIEVLQEKKTPNSILWAGRFIDWKHTDDALRVAKRLKQDGYRFELNFIGAGVMEKQLTEMIRENGLEDCVRILGSMKPEEVRRHMERASIYLFTSDRQEGWGAVLNESMNSACAVVASDMIGSVPFLLENGENGFIYESGNVDMLYEKVKYLLDNPEACKKLGRNAYETMVSEWNAEEAAERLLNLIKDLQEHKNSTRYSRGPCSTAT